MKEYLNTHLEQIAKLVSGLKRDNIDLKKLIELDKELELLGHKIRTVRLENTNNLAELEKTGYRQDAVLYFDHDFKITRYAGMVENFFNNSKPGALPQIEEIFGPKQFKILKKRIEKLIKTNNPQAFNTKIISRNGILLPVSVLLEEISFGKGPNLIAANLSFLQETPTDLKDYQDILIENLPGLDVYLFDNQFRYVLAGGQEKKKLKMTNSDFIGNTLFEVFDEKTQKRLFPFYKNAIDGKDSEGEIRIKDQIYYINSTPIFNYRNEVVGGALISQNVTREKEVERSLIKAKKEAEAADKAKSIFLANMSHEIRTPLNAIIGFTNFLNKSELTPKQKKFSRLINKSSEHLLSVVNEILFLFKLGMGKVFIEKIPFNTHELVKNVYDSLSYRAKEKKLAYKFVIQDNVPEILLGDPFRIKQILMNLATNAIKFTDSGSVLLRVSSESIKKKKAYLKFEVIDTGIGIASENLNKIFVEFEQAGIVNDKTRKGVGLGLTITKKLVELLHGHLRVESEPGKGSTFSVVIPFEMPRNNETVLTEKEYEIRYNLLEDKRVLYADDDEQNILLGETILKEWNTNFELAYDGKEALDILSQVKFDIILLDIQMPQFSGLEIVKKIRKDKKNPNNQSKILAVTANVLEDELKNYLKSGFDDYILKPFREEKLYSKICNLLELKQKMDVSIEENIVEPDFADSTSDFDISLLLKNAAGDVPFFNKMLDTFINNTKNTLRSFQFNLEEENWTEIGEKAHKAIPSFRYFGLDALVNSLSELENLALREKNFEKIPELIKHILEKSDSTIQKALNAKIPESDN